jgi:hypothetical protein
MIIGQSHFSRFINGSLVNSYNAINHLGGNMKRFVQLITAGIALLFLGTSALLAQEATFSPGPAVAAGNGANGGFAWGDVNGDGNLDVFIPSTSITINSITTFAPAASTMTQNLPINTNDVGGLLADFNGDGVLDLFTTNGGTPSSGLYYNTAGVFTAATGTGDLATAGVTGEVFQGAAAAPIDHSNYLSVAWPGTFANISGGTGPYPGGGGIWLLKGGASGFTDVGRGAATSSANLIMDFESQSVGYAFPTIGWSSTDYQSTVALDPVGGTNHVMKNVVHNYNAAPVLAFTLPAGKTLANYNSFIFKGDWAQGDVGYKTIVVEAFQTMPTGQAFNNTANQIGSWYRATNGSNGWESDTVNITNTSSYSGTVYIDFGINCAGTGNIGATGDTTIWYADNVTLVSQSGAAVSSAAIDTSLSYESWDVRFFDANNDGYQDLLMPSFRNGFSRIDTGSSGPRKGCVLFLNDGTGKFYVPTAATLGRTINSIGAGGAVSTTADTGIIVDDTVRHFAAIGEQWGDLNNDGIEDLILNGLNATDNLDGNGNYVGDVILYGKGDGTFTYKWNGVNVVASNGLVQDTHQRAIDVGDYNNDGLADIYTSVTNGGAHLYRNNGNGTFTDVATQDAVVGNNARAGGFVDYNNDGFLDIFQFTGGSTWLQKNNGNTNHWIGFTPVGAGHNMSAIGARFTVYTGSTKQIRVIKAEGGSAGMGGTLRANFGLGATASIDSVTVLWPDGTKKTWTGATLASVVNKYWTIVEGSDVPAAPVKVRPSYVASHDTALANYDTLSWNAAAAGAVGSLTYEAQVSTSSAFSTLVKDVTGLSATNTIVRLGYSTKYFWRVREFQSGFTGPWAAADSFSTKYLIDTVTPKPIYPAANQLGLPLKPTLKVSYVNTASTYQMQVDTVNKYITRDTATVAANKITTALVINDSTTAQDTFYVFTTNLKPNVKYFWRTRGWNLAGSSKWSSVDSFTVMFVPATPVLAYPIKDAPNVPTNLTFKWNRVVPAGQTTPGDSNYVVQFWTYGTTSSGSVVTLMTSDTTKHDSSLVITGLQNLARYYWKVMTFNQGGASAFTAVDSFTTATAVPGSPAVVSPKSTTGENRIEQFVWNSTPNSTSYHMQVSTSASFTTVLIDLKLVDTSIVVTQDTLAANTRYYWHVSAVNAGGEGAFSGASTFTTSTLLDVALATSEIPKVFALNQNYPNPFNPSTTISYDIPRAAFVNVDIYDVLGRRVISLVDGIQSPNHYVMQWNASNVSSGIYFLRIRAHSQDGSDNFNAVKKLMLMK